MKGSDWTLSYPDLGPKLAQALAHPVELAVEKQWHQGKNAAQRLAVNSTGAKSDAARQQPERHFAPGLAQELKSDASGRGVGARMDAEVAEADLLCSSLG